MSGSRWASRSSGESAQKAFIALFGQILRLQNILTSFDDFAGNEILTERQSQDYRSVYLDLYAEFRRDQNADKESINDDVVFEIELIKQVEINVDYILMLVQKYREARGDGEDMEIRADDQPGDRLQPDAAQQEGPHRGLRRLVSRPPARSTTSGRPTSQRAREADLDEIIEDENLKPDETRAFIDTAFRDGAIQTTGTAITKVLPPVSRFSARRWPRREEAARAHQARRVLRAVLRADLTEAI